MGLSVSCPYPWPLPEQCYVIALCRKSAVMKFLLFKGLLRVALASSVVTARVLADFAPHSFSRSEKFWRLDREVTCHTTTCRVASILEIQKNCVLSWMRYGPLQRKTLFMFSPTCNHNTCSLPEDDPRALFVSYYVSGWASWALHVFH